ncbi:MAG: universal stress protein [Burkholderiaceae bacterium]|jgi:nucleotide-binding universal stress UspA family protein
MKSILVPVDGSDNSMRAVKAAIDTAKQADGVNIHVINVQMPIASGNVKSFFSADAINGYYQDEGRTALLPAKALLDEAGIAYSEEILVGQIGSTIADYVKKHNCDQIIMGTRGLGAIKGMVLGSVATKVLNQVDIPVTLIK